MVFPEPRQPANPWQAIDLDVYESHMGDSSVDQLARLRALTVDQLRDHPARRIGILGVAGGNGLDLLDADRVDEVVGYDVNPAYLDACRARYGDRLGAALRLVECSIDRTVVLRRTDLLIANLIVEYVGMPEFAAFAGRNASEIGVLSCITQQNRGAGLVSRTAHSIAFDGLASIASEVDQDELATRMTAAGYTAIHTSSHPLPNGKVLVRQDFASAG